MIVEVFLAHGRALSNVSHGTDEEQEAQQRTLCRSQAHSIVVRAVPMGCWACVTEREFQDRTGQGKKETNLEIEEGCHRVFTCEQQRNISLAGVDAGHNDGNVG